MCAKSLYNLNILSPEFNLNVEVDSSCSTDEITQKVWLKLARFEERAERDLKFFENL
jgi:hypothetical protein